MPIVYLEPGDFNTFQVQRILDFLNRATSARQLDRDIEFPGEPDIGVRLGQRLLDAREALGGRFTDIAQVRAIRLIGPERFTEICVAALGLDPRRWVELFFGANPMATPTETGLGVSLDVLPQPAWRGQPLAVTVRVRDHGGTPRAGVAVTVQTGIGRLVYMFGFTRIEGAAVTVLTGGDGAARLELVTPPREPLSDVQQAALEFALTRLDATATDPLKLEAEFRALAADYALERNYNLRRAIDIHVREFRETMIESLNPGRWRLEWPVDSALLQADAVDADGGGSSAARAVRTVAWKNWIGAWLEFHADALREGTQLADAFAGAAGGKGAAVIDDLLLEARRFVALQPGRAAEWLGTREIAAAARDLVGGDLERLDPAARAAVLTEFEVAAGGVRPTTFGSYTLVAHASADLSERINAVEAAGKLDAEHLRGVLADIDQRAALMDERARGIEALAESVRRDRLAVDEQLTRLDTRIDQFDTQFGQFTTQIGQFNNQIGQFNTQITQFNTQLGQFGTQLNQFNTRVAQFDSQFSQFSTNLTRFNADLATFNTNRTALTTRIDGLQSDLQTVRLDVRNLGGGGIR